MAPFFFGLLCAFFAGPSGAGAHLVRSAHAGTGAGLEAHGHISAQSHSGAELDGDAGGKITRRTGTSHSISLRRQSYSSTSRRQANTKGGRSKIVHKTAYYGQVEVGNPRQPFTVVFDTGSGNLMLPSTHCQTRACTMHRRFNADDSRSVENIQADGSLLRHGGNRDQMTVTFGTGEITGVFLRDDVCIGNLCTSMHFIGATDETDDPFASFNFDGVLGLALPQMSQGPEFSIMDHLVHSGALKNPLFSVFLSDSDLESSEITFGDIKRNHMASSMFWAPVSKDTGYWQVQIDDIAIDNKPISLCQNCQVAVDTGTSQLAGPSDVINELSNRLDVQRDCSNYNSLPLLGFVMGSHVLNLKPQDYVDKGEDGCQVSLMSLDVPPPNGPLFIFGDPFLRKYYTAYDRKQNRVGFAAARHEGQSEEEPALLLATVAGPGRVERRGFLAAVSP